MTNYLLVILLILLVIKLSSKNRKSNGDTIKKKQYGKISNTLKGHKVRSIGERQIANWLYNNNIRYKYEPRMSKYIPDFYLPDYRVIIEYYGLSDANGVVGENYRQKILNKRDYFSNLSVRFVELYREDLNQLDYIFHDLLHKASRKLNKRS